MTELTRRMLGSAAAGGLVAAAAIGAARAQSARKTFVLVHGAFCGSWIWRRVADQLEQSGHKVFVPALTGLGERSHLLRKDVDLDTHIADVVNLIKWESLENVCLVAWSYAGFVGSGALESIGNRVSSIVWLDAFLPANGHKVVDLLRLVMPYRRPLTRARRALVHRRSFPLIFVAEGDGHSPRPSSARNRSAPFSSRSNFPSALEKVAKKTYIRLPKFPQPAYDKALADCKGDKSWATFELPDAGHMAMLDAPDRVRELILQAA